ncbi:MAG: kumamolisin [Pseudonocardiales bacterium]|jgi:hypothetical protein|nr:kumamolisin [Pseudonocardiales bacterium]
MNEPRTPDLDNLELRPLPGSERPPAREISPAAAPLATDSPISVTLVLRRKAEVPDEALSLLQPALYAAAQAGQVQPGFRDITFGTNGAYPAGPGWDPCTGLGVPDGTKLLAALQAAGS